MTRTATAASAEIELWRLQARMARDVVNANTHGLTHEDSLVEPRPGGNRLNWVLGHLLSVYDGFLPLLKQEPVIGPATQRFARGSPPLTDPLEAIDFGKLVAAWNQASERVDAGLARLDCNELCLPPSEAELATYREAMTRVPLHRYPDVSGDPLRRALARRWDVAPEQILLGNGSVELIALLMLALGGDPPRAVVYPDPSFPQYEVIAHTHGLHPVVVPLGPDFALDEARYADALDRRVGGNRRHHPVGAEEARGQHAEHIAAYEIALAIDQQRPVAVTVGRDDGMQAMLADPAEAGLEQRIGKRLGVDGNEALRAAKPHHVGAGPGEERHHQVARHR